MDDRKNYRRIHFGRKVIYTNIISNSFFFKLQKPFSYHYSSIARIVNPYLRKLYPSSPLDLIRGMAELAAIPALEFLENTEGSNKAKGKGKGKSNSKAKAKEKEKKNKKRQQKLQKLLRKIEKNENEKKKRKRRKIEKENRFREAEDGETAIATTSHTTSVHPFTSTQA